MFERGDDLKFGLESGYRLAQDTYSLSYNVNASPHSSGLKRNPGHPALKRYSHNVSQE